MQDAKDAPAKPEAKGEVRPPSADKKAPGEWAAVCGFVDPPTKEGGRCSAKLMKAWRHTAAAAFHGWGTRLPIDLPMTKAEYIAAVDVAMSLPLGDPKNDAALKRLAAKEKAR